MRVISWNVYRGEVQNRLDDIAYLAPDIVCLQECRGGAVVSGAVVSEQRTAQQGIAIWAKATASVTAVPKVESAPFYVRASLANPYNFDVLGIWTHREPSYTKCFREILNANLDIENMPALVVGDFNSHPRFNKRNRGYSHADLVVDLEALGYLSAYHVFFGIEHGEEVDSTYYHLRKELDPFHIDYCFIPKTMAELIVNVQVPGFDELPSSDHRPLIVDLDC